MKALQYAQRLIRYESTSHLSNQKIAAYIENKLQKHGFATERHSYTDDNAVEKFNIVGKKGNGVGGLAYFCHNDVVPADNWFSDKFGPTDPAIARERLYGRGACDMKGSIACMLEAMQAYGFGELKQPLYFVCTADEEVGMQGARHVVSDSRYYREMIDNNTYGIIGEPTMLEVVHAHKGGCTITATSKGRAGHSSTREAKNANLAMIPFLAEMKSIHDETIADAKWHDSEFDPPTLCWNIGINDHTHAVNIAPGQSVCTVFFRPMPNQDVEPLIQRCQKVAEANHIELRIDRYNDPLYTNPDSAYVNKAVELAHTKSSRTVGYGTDGGVFTELENLIVFGPGSIAQAHTVDEWIAIEQLSLGVEMYIKFIREFCT